MGAGDYTWWRQALAGNPGPVHDGQPQCGFYRTRQHKDGPWLPAAIWLDVGDGHVSLRCQIGTRQTDASEAWTRLARHPVSEADYRAATKTGVWPTDPSGHNQRTVDLNADADDEASLAEEWLREHPAITSREQADMAANMRSALLTTEKRAKEACAAEVAPLEAEITAVKQRYLPLIERVRTLADRLRGMGGDWLRGQEAAGKAAMAEAEAAGLAVTVVPVRSAGGARGNAMSLRTQRRAVVTDYAAALHAVRDHPDVVELVQKLANAAARSRAGVALPGTEIITERVAA